MSLVVVDADEEASRSLEAQLKELDFETLATSDLNTAQELCQHSLPELLCCADLEWSQSLASAHRRLPVVYLSSQAPSAERLLVALREGLADVWQLPASDDFLKARISVLLERARLAASQAEVRLNAYLEELQRDQRAGRYIQMGMLPPNPMAIEQYRLQHRILPSLILSGDFVDYFRITDRHFAFYVADVSGHGASSAFVTVLLKNFSRRLRREYRPSMLEAPGEILEWINRELLEQKIDKHVAMMLAVGDLETNVLRLVNAGHFPSTIMTSEGAEPRFLVQRGKPVGLFEDVSYESLAVELNAGDRLVMFSDGVLECMGDDDLAAKEARLLAAARHSEMDAIWSALGVAEGANPDDMTCLTVRRER
jgi:serine phosphatase RsbU (regulator of sigma subunit)